MLYRLLMLCLVEFSVVLYCKEENTLVKYSFHRRFASVGSIPTMEQNSITKQDNYTVFSSYVLFGVDAFSRVWSC